MANELNVNQPRPAQNDDVDSLKTNQDRGLAQYTEKVNKALEGSNIKRNFRQPAEPRPNPLSKFSSYTYQLTLYMITPDAYEAFLLSGRSNINALGPQSVNGTLVNTGAFVLAQSGGINNTTSQKFPNFKYDYYIDDLKVKSLISPKSIQTSSVLTEISFNIYEPYGFSFISNVQKAAQFIAANSKVKNIKNNANQFKQFFILGIRFQGYDESGNVITPDSTFSQDTRTIQANASGVYERFYDILINEMKYKLGNGPTVYAIKATMIPHKIGYGTKFGVLKPGTPISATTVEEGIQQMLEALNKNELASFNANACEIPNRYAVRFIPENSKEISGAKLKNPADLDKLKTAMANFSYSTDISEKEAVKATMDNSKQNITFSDGVSIVHAIQRIISQSEYLEKALKVVYTTANQPNPKTDQPNQIEKGDVPKVKWYNCGVEVKCLGFDNLRKDWSYQITYVIQPYEAPAAFSAYTKSTQYYGPAKRYRYWFTGQNSEILNYEQTLNNNYFMVALTGDRTGQASGVGVNIPIDINRPAGEDKQGSKGFGAEAKNSFLTNLFDPSSILEAKIRILGDPDFLVMTTPESINQVYNQFYSSNGFTINATGGQVFIEIDFNEAVDYDNQTGLLNVNESIMLWPYPPEIAQFVKGVSYMVVDVTSTFAKGVFQQDLNLILNQFPNAVTSSKTETNQREPTTEVPIGPNVRKPIAPISSDSQEVFRRTGVNPSNIQGGRGVIIPPAARPNSNDDNQSDLPGRAVPGAGNIGDFPAA